jgi:heme oxygenase
MSLKELTHENHKRAETRPFVKVLFSGNIDPEIYAQYLYNQFPMYELLEVCAMPHGLVSDMPGILRAKAIMEDFREIWGDEREDKPKICKVVQEYMNHIMSIKDDPKKLMAHMYVRHMGDLSGGQIIKRFVPGSGQHYQFNEDVTELKEKVRAKLHDGLADEAKVCFNMIKTFMEELETSLGMELSD